LYTTPSHLALEARTLKLCQSFLECKKHHGRFHGTLDIKTLGGAGFASQRTTGDGREWDLSGYVGISIDVKVGDSALSNPPTKILL